jgi:hypothetical protein
MQLYGVMATDYESWLAGVYSTKELAEAARAKAIKFQTATSYRRYNWPQYDYEIIPIELDQDIKVIE